MIIPAAAAKKPLPLVPVLAVVALAAVAAAGVFYLRAGQRADEAAAARAASQNAIAELAQARERVRALERDLEVTKTDLAAALKTLPVEVSFQVGEPGTGFVAHFVNSSTVPLSLQVEPRRAGSGEYARLEITVPAKGSGDLGEKQGWAFRSGDTLAVTSGDFHPLSLQVP